MAHIDKKKTSGGEGGLGGSLKNSLSKFTQRVTLKAPEPKPAAAQQAPRSQPPSQPPFASPPQPVSPPSAQVKQAPAPAPQQAAPSDPTPAAPPRAPAPTAASPQAIPQPSEKRIMPTPAPEPVLPRPASNPVGAKNQISEDVTIDGKITFPGSLFVNGKIRGEIHSKGELNLLPNSMIEASISVKTIIIEGKVVGNITATESAHLAAGATVIGDITTAKLSMEPTSQFQGQAKIGTPTLKD